MNGKAAQLERGLEAIRQRALTNSLGQVTCEFPYHDPDIAIFGNCQDCGAAV